MLPPVDPTVLTANPKFEALYRDLCTNRLNSDGTTIPDAKVAKEREAFATELHNARFEAAKRDIVKSGLKELAYRGDALPNELLELVAITVALLEGRIPPEDREVAQDYVEAFLQTASPISTALSPLIVQRISDLSHLVSPDKPIPPASLAPSLLETKAAIARSQDHISTLRLNSASTATTLLGSQLHLLTTLISTLERQIHGAQSRATKAHAEHLSLVAQGMAKKLRLQHSHLLNQLYSSEVQAVLKERFEASRAEERRIRRACAEREEVLERLRGVKGMEGLRGEYGEVVREVEKVRAEVQRLQVGG